jgi:hypothetical protein
MNPAKIVIQGDFWDCQIYRGRLYLWSTDGSLRVIDWYRLVESFIDSQEQELALTAAFLEGRLLYAPETRSLFKDPELRAILTKKFADLANRTLVVEARDIDTFTIDHNVNPFKELQTDSEILNNKIFALTYDGFTHVKTHLNGKRKVGTKTHKINDYVGFSLRAGKYARLALSCGEEGLFEYNAAEKYLMDFSHKDSCRQISFRHSSFADFNFLSLYNSSLLGHSFLSLFKMPDGVSYEETFHAKYLEKEISEEQIFGVKEQNALSWGTNEKIYYASGGTLRVTRFNNYDQDGQYFYHQKLYEFQQWKGKILRGGGAYFGTIIECENALVVLIGEDKFHNIPGAATRWRVYPRSFKYENHLHVIQDDRLEIYSFNHDYFQDQTSEKVGIIFRPNDYQLTKSR